MYLFLAALGLCCLVGAFWFQQVEATLCWDAQASHHGGCLLLPSALPGHSGFSSCSTEL